MINNVVLVGRMTRDAELRYTPSNVAVATFSLAVNRNFKGANGERETDFINCVIWRQQAENLANWAKKGAFNAAQAGRPRLRKSLKLWQKLIYSARKRYHPINSRSSILKTIIMRSITCLIPLKVWIRHIFKKSLLYDIKSRFLHLFHPLCRNMEKVPRLSAKD